MTSEDVDAERDGRTQTDEEYEAWERQMTGCFGGSWG